MPPKFRPRADGPPSASLLSGADGPPISPGNALLDDYSIRSPGVPSPVDALVSEPGSVPDDLAFHIMQWLLASATADADASTQDLLDARDARGRAASQELLLESDRLSFRASLRDAEAGFRAADAAAFARDAETRAAASAAAASQRVLFDTVSATRLHATVQRSFPRAAVSEHRDWCSHLADLRLIQERLLISDTVLFYNVAQTLKGNLLHTWRGFMLTTLDKVEMAAPDDPFPWLLAFEHLVVTPADFHRAEASWRSLSQLADPSLSLTALMRAYETAFISWGRHAASVLEATRVSVFLQSLSQRYRDYLGMPGSPLRVPDALVPRLLCLSPLFRTFRSAGGLLALAWTRGARRLPCGCRWPRWSGGWPGRPRAGLWPPLAAC